jgi:Fe-S oxidoreductase
VQGTLIDPSAPIASGALPGWLLVLAIGVAAVVCAWRAKRWLRGRYRRPTHLLHALASLPHRYLIDVHDVAIAEPSSARMHVLAAGGVVATIALTLLGFLVTAASAWSEWLLLPATAATFAGAALDQYRRRSVVAARLSGGGYAWLPFALAAFAGFHAVVALSAKRVIPAIDWQSSAGVVLLGLGLLGTFAVVVGFGLGPMRHAFAGTLHLVFHPRPGRFERKGPDAALQPLELSSEPLGVEVPRDFWWNQLLSFDACVQCGRCELACPAFAAGASLNPKKLIFDLWAAGLGPGTDRSYAGHPHPGQEGRAAASGAPTLPLVGAAEMVHPDTLWACTTCRACVQSCPMLIEHVDAIVDLRRFQTLERGATPGRGPQVIENLLVTGNGSGKAPERRLDWATDLGLPVAAGLKRRFDILLWLGEAAFDMRGQRTLRALVELLRRANVDFAVLGTEEEDTGDVARRLGDEAAFQILARRNIATLSRHRFTRILTADPHVLHALRQEYPAFGGRYDVVHHTTFIAELIESGRLELGEKVDSQVTYHDPCYLGRYNGEYEAPRRILKRLGMPLVEMERSGPRSFCCGGGGGAPLTDMPVKRRVSDIRMDQIRATGAGVVAVACPNCTLMLEGVSGVRPAVVDIAELVAHSAAGTRPSGS